MTPPNAPRSAPTSEVATATPAGGAAPRLRRSTRFGLRPAEWALVAAIVVAVLLTGLVDSNHSYFRLPWQSLTDILRNTALLGIFALGATVVIIAGGIDLSSGSMIALSGTIAATTMLALAPKEIMAFKAVGPVVVGVGVSLVSLICSYILFYLFYYMWGR
jgi:ribose/xylose/arabinose/galactoside ABC-type transport system permease subunit